MRFVCILGKVNISYIFCFIFRDLLTFSKLWGFIFQPLASWPPASWGPKSHPDVDLHQRLTPHVDHFHLLPTLKCLPRSETSLQRNWDTIEADFPIRAVIPYDASRVRVEGRASEPGKSPVCIAFLCKCKDSLCIVYAFLPWVRTLDHPRDQQKQCE